MQTKAISTLMMVSDQMMSPKNWEPERLSSHEPIQAKQKQTNLWTLYQKHKENDQKPTEDCSKLQLTSSHITFSTPSNEKLVRTRILTNNKNFPSLHKKLPSNHQFTQFLKKKYIFQSFKSFGNSNTIHLPSPPEERKKRSYSQIPHTISIPSLSLTHQQSSQTHHCFRNQMIKQLLDQKSTYLTQLKSKINHKLNKSTIAIYSRKKTKSPHPSNDLKLNRLNSTLTPVPPSSTNIRTEIKDSKQKCFFIKNILSHSRPKNIFKVYSLSII